MAESDPPPIPKPDSPDLNRMDDRTWKALEALNAEEMRQKEEEFDRPSPPESPVEKDK